MKRLLLFWTTLTIFSSINAQEWFPIGAQWHYTWRYHLYTPPYAKDYPEIVTVVKDTVVLNKACKKLVHETPIHSTHSNPVTYVYDSAGKVYYYPPLTLNSNSMTEDKWSLLYDFTKNIGDTIFFPNMKRIGHQSQDTITYYNVIDTVFYRIINGDSLKTYFSTTNLDYWGLAGSFATIATEVIAQGGPIMIDQHWSYEGFTISPRGMRCYEDSNLGFYKSPGFNLDCDVIINSIDEGEISRSSVAVHPNPANNRVTMKFNTFDRSGSTVTISDLNGRLYKKIHLNSEMVSFDISSWPNGAYVYQIQSHSGAHHGKFIKQ